MITTWTHVINHRDSWNINNNDNDECCHRLLRMPPWTSLPSNFMDFHRSSFKATAIVSPPRSLHFSIRWDDGRCCRDESRLTPLHQRRLHELIRTFEDIKNEKKFTCKVRKHQIDVAIIWGKSSTRGEIATTWPLWTIEEHFLMSSEADSEDVYDRALVEWESYSYNLPSFGDS